MVRHIAFLAVASLIASAAALAQLPERVLNMRGPINATPLDWKWKKLGPKNTFWNYVRNKGGPLVVSLPGAPSEGSYGIDDHMSRLFYEEGYTIGVLTWRDGRARRQSPSDSVAEVTAQFAEVRANPERFGGFDRKRIVVVGWGEDAFPAALVAFNRDPGPVCAAIFIDGMNFDTTSPDTVIAKRKFAEEANPAELSPVRHAADAPPTLLLTEVLDSASAERSDKLAAAIRAGGGIAVRATYPRFEVSDPTTYLGYSENPSTEVIAQFLRTYCPAKDPDTTLSAEKLGR